MAWNYLSIPTLQRCNYLNLKMDKTARHFRWPCAIFADTGVFKIRITILKSKQFVAFLWDFCQIPYDHQSNTKNNIKKYNLFKISNLSSSMEFHGTGFWIIKNSMEFHGIPWNSEHGKSSMEFHGTLDLDIIPWNSMELEVLLLKLYGIPWTCCSKSSMELWRKFHGTFWSKQVLISIEKRFWMRFEFVLSNARNAYGIMQILIIKHKLLKETYKNV